MNPQHTASPAFEADALVADAERRERAAADALGDARATHANAREAARLARDTRDRAVAIKADARAAHERAAARAEEVERAWQRDQSDARWAAVEAARSMRDQAELRARQAAGAVQRADADVALAERRLASAAEREADAARDHRGAEDVLAGHRSAWQCRSADEARRRGEELRREGEWRRDRDAWQAALDDELGAALLGYLRAVQALREAEGEVERVRSSLAGRVESINLRAGRAHTPEASLDLRLPGPLVAAELARRVFPRAQEGFAGGSLYAQRALASGPWGSAPEALHQWREHAESASSRAVATALRLAREAGLVEPAPRRARDAAGVAQASPPVAADEAPAGSFLSRGLRGVFERLAG